MLGSEAKRFSFLLSALFEIYLKNIGFYLYVEYLAA